MCNVKNIYNMFTASSLLYIQSGSSLVQSMMQLFKVKSDKYYQTVRGLLQKF